MRFSLPLCLCGVLFLTAAYAAPVTEQAYQRVAGRLMCQCGCGQTVAGCNHYQCSSAETLRKEVREAIANSPSEERAVEALVQKWGVKLLAEPPRSGFNLAAWVTPFMALLAGLFVIALVLKHWRQQTVASAAAAPVDPEKLSKYAPGIDREIEES